MRLQHSIRFKVRILFSTVFLIVTIALSILLLSETLKITKLISKDYAELYTNEIVGDINAHLNREIGLTLKAANTDVILSWMKHENDDEKRRRAFDEIVQFNLVLEDENFFIAVNDSKNFYFVENSKDYSTFMPTGILSSTMTEDEWYFRTIASAEPYILNIDTDRFLKTLRAWINVKVVSEGKIQGVLGTGLYLDPFVRDIFEKRQTKGVKSVIVNEFGAVQMDSNIENIQQNSFDPVAGKAGTVFEFFAHDQWNSQIQTYLKAGQSPMVLELEDERYNYVALAPIENTNWYVVTFFDANTLFKASNLFPFISITVIIFIILGFILNMLFQRVFIKPFELMNRSIQKDGSIIGRQIFGQDRNDEFGVLAKTIQLMKTRLDSYNKNLESEVESRSEDLKAAYQTITVNEARLNRLFKNIPVGIFMLDSDFQFCYGNPYFLKQFGFDTEEQFKAKYSNNYRRLFINPKDYDTMMSALQKEPDVLTMEFHLRSDTQGAFWADVRFTKASELWESWRYEGILINIQVKKDYEMKLMDLATIDRLTGIHNRHFFDNLIEDEMHRSARYDESLSLMIFDLDRFKQVNDTWGHDVGDEVLKLTTKVVADNIRKSDVFARWGGEEFIVLLPHTSRKGAAVLAEKVRSALENTLHPYAGVVTASFGVSEYIKDEPFTDWFKRVDEALFKAKDSGRNCVVVAESPKHLSPAFIKLIWKSDFESGVKSLDDEHKDLFALANSLMDYFLEPDSFALEMHQFDLMTSHVMEHFKNEEALLSEVNYPELDAHKKLHKKLCDKLSKNREKFFNGELKALEIFAFLVDEVLVDHILKEDVKYFPYLNIELIDDI